MKIKKGIIFDVDGTLIRTDIAFVEESVASGAKIAEGSMPTNQAAVISFNL